MKTAVRFSLERIVALDRAVRAGDYPNAAALARLLEVSHRTVQRDVEFFRDRLGAPLEFDPRRNGYFYRDPSYRLPFLTLTEGELGALFLAERSLRQYSGTPYAAELARAFRKVTLGVTERVAAGLGLLGRAHSFRASAPSGLDPEMFGELEAAILGRRRLAVRYYTASRDEETTRELDPYHLATVDGQWYLVGHCHRRDQVRMFVPARIRAVEATGATFEPPPDFCIEEYLARSFAVLRGGEGELHRVRLRFTGEAVRYVRERAWHASQVVEPAPDGGLVVGLELGHLREVERWALSWGPDCEVLEPAELRSRMASATARAAGLYSEVACDRPGADRSIRSSG